MNEHDYQRRIIQAAQLHGWLVAHHRPARTNRGWRTPTEGDTGVPDLILARGGHVLLAEIKSGTGRLTTAQRGWLDTADGHGRLWRPADWQQVLAELETGAVCHTSPNPGS